MNRKGIIGVVTLGLVVAAFIGLVVGLTGRGPTLQTASAQATPNGDASWNGQGGIAVEGVGTVLVKPDVVQANIGVQAHAPTVTEAQKGAADQSQKLTDALKKAGIKDDDIKTTNYSVAPNYIYANSQPPKLDGYNVNNQLTITIRDLSKAGEVLDAVGNAGATQISGISFTLDNNADALKKARAAAMDDARQRADQLAGAGKFGVGSVVKVSETNPSLEPQPLPMADRAAVASSQAQTVVEAGQFKVQVHVTVTYSIK